MLTSLYVRLIGAAVLVAALIFGWHELTSHYDRQGYTRAKAEDTAAADQQAARNRELQRQAELHYTVQAATREKFFVTTVREVHDAAAPLAACAVPDSVRVRVNDAIACAVSDSAATCGTDGEVPAAAAPAGRGSSK